MIGIFSFASGERTGETFVFPNPFPRGAALLGRLRIKKELSMKVFEKRSVAAVVMVLAIVAGIFIALRQRYKEIDKGEEDEARKY